MPPVSAIPELPASLYLSLLPFLLPPKVPLPPGILSPALLQRHSYLTPTLEAPITHFTLTTISEDDQEEIRRILEGVEQEMSSGDHPPLTPTYASPDPETLLGKVELHGSHLHSYGSAPAAHTVDLQFIYVPAGETWRFHNLALNASSSSSSSSSAWFTQIPIKALQTTPNENDESNDDPSTVSMGSSADDYWGGYSSDEENSTSTTTVPKLLEPEDEEEGDDAQTPPAIQSNRNSTTSLSGLASANSRSGLEMDSYWASYGAVDDGIAGTSRPLSPGIQMRSYQPGEPGKAAPYYGTGGETPIGWSPAISEAEDDEERSYFPAPSPAPSQPLYHTPLRDVNGLSNENEEPTPIIPSLSTSLLPASPTPIPVLTSSTHDATRQALEGLWKLHYLSIGNKSKAMEEFMAIVKDVVESS